MRVPSWLRPLAARLNLSRSRRVLQRPAFRPCLEALEDRTVPTAVPPPAGLTNWWPGDGNALDIAGNSSSTFEDYATGEVDRRFTSTAPSPWV